MRMRFLVSAVAAFTILIGSAAEAQSPIGVWKGGNSSFTLLPGGVGNTFYVLEGVMDVVHTASWVPGLEGTQLTWKRPNATVAKVTFTRDMSQGTLDPNVAVQRVNALDKPSTLAGTWRTASGAMVVVAPDADGQIVGAYVAPGGTTNDGLARPLTVPATFRAAPNSNASMAWWLRTVTCDAALKWDAGSVGPVAAVWTQGRWDPPGRGVPERVWQISFPGGQYHGTVTITFDPAGTRNVTVASSSPARQVPMTAEPATWPASAYGLQGAWAPNMAGVQFTVATTGTNSCRGTVAGSGAAVAFDASCGSPWTRVAPWPVRPAASGQADPGNTIAGRWSDGVSGMWTIPSTTQATFDIVYDSQDRRTKLTFPARWNPGLVGRQFLTTVNYEEFTFTFDPANPNAMFQHGARSGDRTLGRVP